MNDFIARHFPDRYGNLYVNAQASVWFYIFVYWYFRGGDLYNPIDALLGSLIYFIGILLFVVPLLTWITEWIAAHTNKYFMRLLDVTVWIVIAALWKAGYI